MYDFVSFNEVSQQTKMHKQVRKWASLGLLLYIYQVYREKTNSGL